MIGISDTLAVSRDLGASWEFHTVDSGGSWEGTQGVSIDHRRRQSPATSAPFGDEAEQQLLNTPEETPGPEARAYANELGEVLESEIARLPAGQRIVFVMRHHQGLKLCEIADALGLAEGTVKRQLHAAVHRLRHALSSAKVTAGGRA